MELEIIKGRSQGHQLLLDQMFCLRKEVFFDRLGWDVCVENGMEIDKYDDQSAVYMVAHDKAKVQAGWRLLPTSGPNMLQDVFPELAAGEQIPSSNKIWEISRWAAVACDRDLRAQAHANASTMQLIKCAYDFARENDIERYLVVTSVAMERLCKSIGLPISRFGDQRATRIGQVLSVACWVDINDVFHNVVYPSKAA